MPGYFSFQRCITVSFVKALYFIGFMVLTAGGIGLAIWAGLGLYQATLPRELGWYYLAGGVGILILGNFVWRVFCEIWVVPFNIYVRLVSLDQKIGASRFAVYEQREDGTREVEREEMPPQREPDEVDRSSSVLGLS